MFCGLCCWLLLRLRFEKAWLEFWVLVICCPWLIIRWSKFLGRLA